MLKEADAFMKKLTALLLALVLLFLAGCQKNTENLRGDVNSRNALRIFIDIPYARNDIERLHFIDDFTISLKQTGGLENIVFELLPDRGTERSTAIARLRTEIMAGTGPDVFIVESGYNHDIFPSLFPFPEKSMDVGLFLPLDEYMENNTEFTEWDKQQPTVLAAGRNDEGQQIIPLTYTFPVQTCYTTDFAMEYSDIPLSWQDTLTDPKLSAAYAKLNDCIDLVYEKDTYGKETFARVHSGYFEHILGRIVDYEEEELLFTEEELLVRINEVLTLQKNSSYQEKSIFKDQFMGYSTVNSDMPITFMPMYSDDGGITASIRQFAAVNRNTKHPEDAFRVIDVLMRSHTQLTKPLYIHGFCSSGLDMLESIPLYDETFHKDSPFDDRYFTDESYESFTQMKKQITAANFRTSISYDLYMLIVQCAGAEVTGDKVEDLVHAAYESMQRKIRE